MTPDPTKVVLSIDSIWGEEPGLCLALTELEGGGLKLAIHDASKDQLIASVAIANFRVQRIAQLATQVSAKWDFPELDAEREAEAKLKRHEGFEKQVMMPIRKAMETVPGTLRTFKSAKRLARELSAYCLDPTNEVAKVIADMEGE